MLKYVRDNNNHYQNVQPNKLNNQLTNQTNIFNIFNQNIYKNKYKPFRIVVQDIKLKQKVISNIKRETMRYKIFTWKTPQTMEIKNHKV